MDNKERRGNRHWLLYCSRDNACLLSCHFKLSTKLLLTDRQHKIMYLLHICLYVGCPHSVCSFLFIDLRSLVAIETENERLWSNKSETPVRCRFTFHLFGAPCTLCCTPPMILPPPQHSIARMSPHRESYSKPHGVNHPGYIC